MKKLLCALMALMMLTAFALAEAPSAEVIDRFSDTWVDAGAAMEIWYDADDAAFHCTAVLGDGGDVSDKFEYASCRYDADSDTLICEDGARTHEDHGESTVTDGLTAAVFFADVGDRLIWNDSEGLAQDLRLRRLEDAEATEYAKSLGFAGRWGCGRATIDITVQDDGTFKVFVSWASSAAQSVEWGYACAYDGDSKCLYTCMPGSKAVVTYAEDGDFDSAVTEYEDGEARFRIDGDGMLIWEDAKENAGEGMRFERGIDFGASGSEIRSVNDTVDMNDGEYPASFNRANLSGDALGDVKLYTVDCYDIVDIDQMAVGDTIVVEGESIRIESLEEDEYGHKLVNGGYDAGGCTLSPFSEDNCWMCVEDDDFNTCTERAEVTLTLSENVVFTDGWDIEKDPVTAEGIEAVTAAIQGSENDAFDSHNTTVRLEDGRVVEIIRRYVP